MNIVVLLLSFLLMTPAVFSQTFDEDIRVPILSPGSKFDIEKTVIRGEPNYTLAVYSVKENGERNVVFLFKQMREFYLFESKRNLLVMAYSPTHGDGALYYICGDTGVIDYLGNFQMGYLVFEKEMMLLARTSRRASSVSSELYLYDIATKKTIWLSDLKTYISGRIVLKKEDYFEVEIPSLTNGKALIENGRLRIWLSHFGEDGALSFGRYLVVGDPRKIHWADEEK